MPIDFSMVDPNLIYLALLAGLWLGVTALYVPGTWIPEITSVVLVAGSLFVLSSLSATWWAIALLFLGVSMFLLLPFFGEKYGRYSELGLVGQLIGGYFMFQDQSVSLILLVVTVVIGLLYNRFVLIPTMKNQRRYNEYDESNAVVGIKGRVMRDVDPVGTVYVNKELWRARSSEPLEKDTPIIVVGQDGLELIVEKAKNEDLPRYEEAQSRASMNN